MNQGPAFSRTVILLLLIAAASSLAAQPQQQPPAGGPPVWPSLQQQLDGVIPGSALEQLIRQNQEFGLLRAEEARDTIRVPAWLRVWWRKNHPELQYNFKDPTGGYPLVLKEVYQWMLSHQDLQPGAADGTVDEVAAKAASVSGEMRISGAQTSPRSESDIRVNYWDPTKIIAASNNISSGGRQAQFRSTDSGQTWSQTTLSLITGDAFHSDPTVDWTSDGTAWSTTIGINSAGTVLQLRSYKSTDNGATWTFDATFSGSQTSADKQIQWVDHSNTSAFKNNIYVIWHNGPPVFVNRRTGPTGSWGTPLQISSTETTGTGIGSDIKTNSFGDVFGFWPDTGSRRVLVAKSTNGGSSYAAPVTIATTFDSFDIGVPSFNGRRALIYVSAGAYRTDTKNLVYASWTDLTGASGCTSSANEPGSNVSSSCKTRIWFARSTNGGTTWQAPVMINNQASLNDQFNQWLVVDETSGKLAIIYYDTVNDSGRKKTDIFYQTSNNDGTTWDAPVRVTSAMTDETVAGADSGNQYGDYNGLSGISALFFPSWTDRRNNAKEEIWTAAINDPACTPPAAPTGLTATAVGSNRIDLTWNAVAGAASYNVLRSLTSGGPYSQVASVTTTSHSDTGLSASTTYFYVVRAVAGCESGNSNQASATTGAGSCTTSTLYTNGFETGSGLSDWTTGVFGGTNADWRGIQTCTAKTGTKIFRFGGSTCTANYGSNRFNFAQPKGATGIAVPAGSSTTRLSFWHRRRFESGFDGGTLTVSLNGTNYFFVSGTAIISGTGYNGTVGTSCPPAGSAGASIFTGVQTSFVNTVVDLDAVCNSIAGGTAGCAGRTLFIAFTSITDCSVTDDGWFLDDVTVTACTP